MTAKIIVTALGLAALVATPALARKPVHHTYAPGPYASVTASASVGGRTIGTDPDANVRLELQRDYPTSIGAN